VLGCDDDNEIHRDEMSGMYENEAVYDEQFYLFRAEQGKGAEQKTSVNTNGVDVVCYTLLDSVMYVTPSPQLSLSRYVSSLCLICRISSSVLGAQS
jgi:hypothetical protein